MALGAFAGTAGIASAASSSVQQAPPVVTSQVQSQTRAVDEPVGSAETVEAPESAASAESKAEDLTETDGVDHRFEGEEIGNNGDGIADANDANEAPEVMPSK